MSVPAVEVCNVSRTYGRGRDQVTALRGVSFHLDEGQILGVLGSNGAGKTTLTKILATLLEPSDGTARIFGYDVTRNLREVRRLTGVVFGGDRGFYGALSGRDNLRYFAMLAGVSRGKIAARVESALIEVGLADAARRAVETYSKGMRQRLHIALGLIAEPRVLLLDEPTVGLDPAEAERLRTAILELRSAGVTVLLTSHYLLDIERLADRVIVIDHGEVKIDVAATKFGRLAGFAATVTVRGRGPLPSHPHGDEISIDSTEERDGMWSVRLRVPHWGSEVFGRLSKTLGDLDVLDVDVAPVRLEDVYAVIMARLAKDRSAAETGLR